MISWKVSLEACKLIKESDSDFCTKPNTIYCEIQSNNGLVFETQPTWNSTRESYDREITEARLITPYGYIDMKFKSNKTLRGFSQKLTRIFYKKDLIGYKDTRYSFTFSSDTTASFKSSYPYIQGAAKLQEEFGKYEYTRTQILAIYERLRTHASIDIHGQAII